MSPGCRAARDRIGLPLLFYCRAPPPFLQSNRLTITPACLLHLCHALPFLQMWHWGEKRRLAQYYSELYAKEKADEDAYTDELRAKLKALEEELLA